MPEKILNYRIQAYETRGRVRLPNTEVDGVDMTFTSGYSGGAVEYTVTAGQTINIASPNIAQIRLNSGPSNQIIEIYDSLWLTLAAIYPTNAEILEIRQQKTRDIRMQILTNGVFQIWTDGTVTVT